MSINALIQRSDFVLHSDPAARPKRLAHLDPFVVLVESKTMRNLIASLSEPYQATLGLTTACCRMVSIHSACLFARWDRSSPIESARSVDDSKLDRETNG